MVRRALRVKVVLSVLCWEMLNCTAGRGLSFTTASVT